MTATVDFRRSDHEREVAPAARGRDESLCLSELMDEILENDAGILDQANDFMHLLPGVDDMGNMASFHLDPFSVFEEEDIEPVVGSFIIAHSHALGIDCRGGRCLWTDAFIFTKREMR